VWGLGIGVHGSGSKGQGLWFSVHGGFRVQGAGCRVQGLGCRVQVFGPSEGGKRGLEDGLQGRKLGALCSTLDPAALHHLRLLRLVKPQLITCGFTSQKVFLKWFYRSQFPHKSVDSFFILVIAKDKLTDLRERVALCGTLTQAALHHLRFHLTSIVYEVVVQKSDNSFFI